MRVEGRGGVGQHVGDAVGRVVGVDRQVGGARLEDGEHGDDGVRGAGQSQRDELFTADAEPDEMPSELIGTGVELPVGQRPAFALTDDRDSIRVLPGLLLDQLMQRCIGQLGAGAVPLDQHPLDDPPR